MHRRADDLITPISCATILNIYHTPGYDPLTGKEFDDVIKELYVYSYDGISFYERDKKLDVSATDQFYNEIPKYTSHFLWTKNFITANTITSSVTLIEEYKKMIKVYISFANVETLSVDIIKYIAIIIIETLPMPEQHSNIIMVTDSEDDEHSHEYGGYHDDEYNDDEHSHEYGGYHDDEYNDDDYA